MFACILQIVISISGIWNAWGYNEGSWAELAPLLNRNGYDTVFYCAAYGLETDIDGLNECIDACSEYNIDVNAWVVMWKISKSSEQTIALLAEQERLQVSTDNDIRAQRWLCPTAPANVADMAEICLKIADSSSIKGIHLDYIRYSSNRVCFCHGCRLRFQYDSGIYGIRWPDACISGGRLHSLYDHWRSEKITSVVSAVRDSLDTLNKPLELSAAVLPRKREMNYYAQHWNQWLQRDIVDFVIPMNYTLSDSELTLWGRSQLNLAENNSIPCGLITSRDNYLFTAEDIRTQQKKAIDMGFDGWVMFHLSDHVISLLKENLIPSSTETEIILKTDDGSTL